MNYPIKHFPFYPSSTLPFGNKIDNSFCPSSARITGNIHTHPGLANDRTDGTRTPVPTGSSDGFSEKCTLPDYPPPVSQHVLAELSFLTSSFPEGPYDIFPTASCNSLPLLPNTSTDCLA
jgi:hypothetical protein